MKKPEKIPGGFIQQILMQLQSHIKYMPLKSQLEQVFLDDTHGYVNGTSVFMFVPQLLKSPLTVTITPFKNWKQISSGMEKVGNNNFVLQASDYDMLADSPIEIGNQKILEFTADGNTKYEVAMYGEANYNEKNLD